MDYSINNYNKIADLGETIRYFLDGYGITNFHKDGICIVAHFDIAKRVFHWIIKNIDVELDSINLVNPEISEYDDEFLISFLDGELSIEKCKWNGKYLGVYNSFIFVHKDTSKKWIDLNLDPELDNILSFFSLSPNREFEGKEIGELDSFLQNYTIDFEKEVDDRYHSFSLTTKDGATFSYNTNEDLSVEEVVKIALNMVGETN